MALCTIVDEGRFQARLNACDFAFVDVGFFLFVTWAFDIQIIQTLPIHKGDSQFFLLNCID